MDFDLLKKIQVKSNWLSRCRLFVKKIICRLFHYVHETCGLSSGKMAYINNYK